MNDTDVINRPKIEIKHLYKIFGKRDQAMMKKVQQGMDKQTLLDTYNHVLGLEDINLTIPAQQISVIMGLSGSGKSTLIRHINRLIEPTAGEVYIDGDNVLNMSKKALLNLRRHKVSMVFQKFGLLKHKTVFDNVAFGLKNQGLKDDAIAPKVNHWLERVGLSGYEGNYPAQLSGGMQQRVGLARALATDADILLMDEAFSALDPLIRTDMQNILLELQEELHKTIVFITHDLDEALRLGDQIAILHEGKVVQNSNAQQILLQPANDYVFDFVKDVNRARILKLKALAKPITDDSANALVIDARTTLEDALPQLVNADQSWCRLQNATGDIIGQVSLKAIVKAMARPDPTSEDNSAHY